jgi:integrase
MPKLPRIPSYRFHKASRQAVVVIRGVSHYLGPWNSPGSHTEYRRVIAEHWSSGAASASRAPAAPHGHPERPVLSLDQLILEYWNRRVLPYYVKDGRPTSEQDNIRQALRFVRRLYGHTPAREFGPLALKAVRQTMIEAGRCRKLINKDVHRIRGMFRWAVGEQLCPGTCLQDLLAVEALEKGRSTAKERPPVSAVAEDVVLATLPFLSHQVAAMVRLQMLTAARPGEIAALRPQDVDQADPTCWVYRPGSHKTQHHGRERVIPIGPRGQDVLRPWLDREPAAYCFSPYEVVADRIARQAPGSRAARPRPGGRYTKDSYRVAIRRACLRAGVPAWTPHQLRHTRSTAIRREYDIEAAQVVLGHSKPDTTVIYAERNLARARDVMRSIG